MTDLEKEQARLDAYLEAERRALDNQAYELNGRRLTRANLAEIRAGIAECRANLRVLRPAGRRVGILRHGW